MDKKKVEILIAILVILALIIALFFLLREPKPASDTPGEVAEETVTEPVSEVDSRTTESPPDVIARTFVERFGSYSTDVDYLNVEDVKALATTSLQAQLDDLLVEARDVSPTSYYGVTTKVITIDTVESSESSATLEMTTQ